MPSVQEMHVRQSVVEVPLSRGCIYMVSDMKLGISRQNVRNFSSVRKISIWDQTDKMANRKRILFGRKPLDQEINTILKVRILVWFWSFALVFAFPLMIGGIITRTCVRSTAGNVARSWRVASLASGIVKANHSRQYWNMMSSSRDANRTPLSRLVSARPYFKHSCRKCQALAGNMYVYTHS